MNEKNSIWYYSVPPLLLIFLASMAYCWSVCYEFQFDDLANIVNNFQVRTGGVWEIFLANTRWISQLLNTYYYQIGKFDPFVYRFANITAHILTGIAVYFVVCFMTERLKHSSFLYQNRFMCAFLTAGFFLLHPAQSQTVSYVIQGQLEGLAALVTMSMILFFLLYARSEKRYIKVISLLYMYLAMLLASGTKEIAIISPLLVLLIDWFFVAQGNMYVLKKHWWIHVTLFMGIFGMYIYFLKPEYFTTILGLKMELHNNMGNMLTDKIGEKITPFWYCISQFKVILHYIGIFFWPFSMSVDYDWVLVENFFSYDCILPFLLLASLFFYTAYRLYNNKRDMISFGIIWFFIAVLPRSTIIPSTELVADYKTYIASFGIFFLWAYLLTWIISLIRKKYSFSEITIYISIILFICAPLACALYQRNKVWRTAEEFWLNILQNAPGKARAYNNYGVSLCAQHKNEQAIPYFKKAQEMDKVYSDPHNNIAVAYGALGRIDDAIKALEASIKICPVQPEAYNNMASFYLEKNECFKAEELLKTALRLRPHYGKAHFNLGRTYYIMGKKDDAFRCFKTACLKADFDTVDAFIFYAGLSLELKKYDEALFAYKKVIDMAPTRRDGLSGIINTYVLKGDPRSALIFFEKLISLFPQEYDLQYKYAETLYSCNRFQDALKVYNDLLIINKGFVPVYAKIALCLYKLNRHNQAYKVLEDFLGQNPPEEFAQPIRTLLHDMKTGVMQ